MSAARALAVALLLIGCTPPGANDAPAVAARPAIMPAAEPPRRSAVSARLSATLPADTPAAVTRDTGALVEQATRYVASRGSTSAAIDRLTMLTVQSSLALRQLRAGQAGTGGAATRSVDLATARVAADALAAFLATVSDERPPARPAGAHPKPQ